MNRPFPLRAFASLSIALATLPAGAAQEPVRPVQDPSQPAREVTPQDQRPQPILVRTDVLAGTDVVDKKGARLGRIVDLVVDTRSGHFTDAVMAADETLVPGKRQVTVRWVTLLWDPLAKRFTTETTREQIQQAPPFQPDQFGEPAPPPRETGERRPATQRSDAGDKETADKARDGIDKVATAVAVPAAAPATHRLASRLAECKVLAGNDDVGTCGGLWAELRTGSMAFAAATLGDVMGIGGTTWLVPWTTIQIRTEAGTQQLQLATMNRRKLEGAPRLETRELVNDPSFRGRVYQYFGVPLPEYEPDRDLMGKIGKSSEDQQPGKR